MWRIHHFKARHVLPLRNLRGAVQHHHHRHLVRAVVHQLSRHFKRAAQQARRRSGHAQPAGGKHIHAMLVEHLHHKIQCRRRIQLPILNLHGKWCANGNGAVLFRAHEHASQTNMLVARRVFHILIHGFGLCRQPLLQILRGHRIRLAFQHYLALVQTHRARAQAIHCQHVVAHKQHRAALVRGLANLAQALPLERRVAYCQHFVHQQNLCLQMRCHRKRQPHIHPA